MVLTIGVMTGNSLDAADVVLTSFDKGEIRDLAGHTILFPQKMTEDLRKIRRSVSESGAEMETVAADPFFINTVRAYSGLVARAVNELVAKSGVSRDDIAAIGFHGQTCDHFPPSVAGGKPPYTVQVADAGLVAESTGIPVIYDFRSDDVMNGGEGAPLAPVHNARISADLKRRGLFPVAFCNAGNTGNISVISEKAGKITVSGWDAGPFNHFPDYLVRLVKKEPFDKGGFFGSSGKIVPELLSDMFHGAAVTADGGNFYLKRPPKSSDPSWYRLPESWKDCVFEDALRTAEYLSAYGMVHTLCHIPEDVLMPHAFLLFGGGWKNPLAAEDFKNLLNGGGYVLPEHESVFKRIRARFERPPVVESSGAFGYDGTYMEARIFADMAYCRITGEAFSFPESTGCAFPTVAGVCVWPRKGGDLLKRLLKENGTETVAGQKGADEPPRLYGRASKGWQKRFNQ